MNAFLSWAAGPDRSLAEVDPAVVDKLQGMATRTLTRHSAPQQDYSVPVADTKAAAPQTSPSSSG